MPSTFQSLVRSMSLKPWPRQLQRRPKITSDQVMREAKQEAKRGRQLQSKKRRKISRKNKKKFNIRLLLLFLLLLLIQIRQVLHLMTRISLTIQWRKRESTNTRMIRIIQILQIECWKNYLFILHFDQLNVSIIFHFLIIHFSNYIVVLFTFKVVCFVLSSR